MKNIPLFALCSLLVASACDKAATPKETAPKTIQLTEQGYTLLGKQQARASIPLFDQAIASDEHYIRAYQGKGIALNNIGKHEEAERIYEKALKIEPGSVGILNNYAMSKILGGHYQEAITMLAPLVKDGAQNATVQENYALAHCLDGKRDEARTLYAKFLPPAQVEENLRFCSKFEVLRTTKKKP